MTYVSKRLKLLKTALIGMAGLIFLFPSSDSWAAGRRPLKIGDRPPQVSLSNLSGSTVRIPEDFRGKVVVLHFWAGGCSSCKEEMPALDALYKKYARKGLVVLAVNVGQRKGTVNALAREMGISYPVLLDPDKAMGGKYDVVGVPRTYLVDRNGVVRFKILGSTTEEMLKKQVLSLL